MSLFKGFIGVASRSHRLWAVQTPQSNSISFPRLSAFSTRIFSPISNTISTYNHEKPLLQPILSKYVHTVKRPYCGLMNPTTPSLRSNNLLTTNGSLPSLSKLSTPFLQVRGFASKKHKAVIKMAKGYRGRANRTFRAAIRRVEKGLQYAYRDRKNKKRDFRRLWIERLNAGTRQHGLSYSRFIYAISQISKASKETSEVPSTPLSMTLNRRMLAELASNEPFSFKAVVDVVKATSGQK